MKKFLFFNVPSRKTGLIKTLKSTSIAHRLFNKNSLSIMLAIIPVFIFSQQNTSSPNILVTDESGNESVLVDCDYPSDENRCFNLKANYSSVNETTAYKVETIGYKNPIKGLTHNAIVEVSGDDLWSTAQTIPFEFCFFDNSYTKFSLGDNGIISFDTPEAGSDCQFIRSKLPSGNLPSNAIFGVFHDMVNVNKEGCFNDPLTPINECGEIKVYTTGTKPQRQLIISYEGMNHFACENIKSTSQIVLYETSNIIEVYVQEKPINCETINPSDDPDVIVGIKNRKNALIGIQNKQKNTAYFPESRNNTEWSATNEAWQFIPNGASVTTVKWRNEAGEYIAEGDMINVCPEKPTTYTAEVTYDVCIGKPIIIDDTIDIDIDIEFPVATDIVEAVCDIIPFSIERVNLTDYESKIIGSQTGLVLSYHRSLNDAKIDTNPILNTSNFMVMGTGTTVYIRLQRGISCYDIGKLELKLTKEGVSAITEIALCDKDNDNIEILTLADYTTQILGGQSNINSSYHATQDDANKDINPITELTASNGDSIFVRLTIGNNKGCPNVIELPIRLKAKPIVQNIPIELCDHILVYDLTQHENEILALNTGNNLNFTYYTRKDWAEKGINQIEKEDTIEEETKNYILNKIPIIYVRAESAEGCFEIFELQFTYKKGIPVENTDQTQVGTVFDLTQSIKDMIENMDGVEVVFFICESNPIKIIDNPENYDINGPEETICVKFINEEGCENTGEIDITSIGGGGSGGGGPLGACDTENDGQEVFILSEFDETIKQNVTFDYPELLVFAYFETQKNANDNVSAIEEITITKNTTLYVRISVVSKNKELKYWVEEILLEFKETYAFKSIDVEICDLKYNNSEKVDLTQYESDILEGSGVTGSFTYFDGENKIDNPNNYTLYNPNPEKEITVIVTTANGCGNETTITLRFESKIVTKNTTLESCDYDTNNEENFNLNKALPEIITNYTDFTIHFYTKKEDAETGDTTIAIKNPDSFDSTVPNQKIHVRIQADSGCYTIAVLDIFVREAPKYKTTEVELCDFENDELENDVDLTQFNTTIIGSSNTSIKYYTKQEDADNDVNAITKLNINKNTTIYTILVSDAVCKNQSPVTFKFIDTPTVTDISIDVCDNLEDSLEEYNLLQHDTDIVTNGNINNKTISYHKSLTGAQNNNDKVQTPAFYKITTAPQTLFARIKDDVTGCYSTSKINISFITPTKVKNISMETCDEFGDGSEFFDITTILNDIIPNPQDFKIAYYSKRDAAINQDDILLINNPKNVDSAINSIVYVRFDKESTGCFSIAEVFLELLKTPKLLPGKYEFCDIDLDGDYVTNLTELNSAVIQNTKDLKFSYYLSYNDANDDENTISNYENYLVPNFPHRIYLRVKGTNGCHSISFVDLSKTEQVIVNPVIEPLQACDDDLDDYAIFDLTSFENKFTPEIGATFNYYNSIEDSKKDKNTIVDPTSHKNNTPLEQDIFVRVHVDGKCDDVTRFTIQTLAIRADIKDTTFCDGDAGTLNAGNGYASYLWSTGETTQTIQITQPGEYSVTLSNTYGCTSTFKVNAFKMGVPVANDVNKVVCDDVIADARVVFNLKDIIPEVTNNNPTVSVTFYEMEKDAENEINKINDLENFKNKINPQKIFIKVYEQSERCYSYATFTMRVSSAESNSATLEVCDEIKSEDGLSIFNLKDADNQVLNGIPVTEVSYFETKQDAYNDTNRLPLEYTNTKPYEQIIYSRILNTDNCASYGSVRLIVRELPSVEDDNDLYCLNTYPNTITLYGIENTSYKNYTYEWNTGEITPTIEVNKIGTYTVKVTNQYGCFKSKNITVTGSNIAKIEKIEIADKSEIGTITVYATGISEYDYSLDGIYYQDSNVFQDVEPGVYTIYVRDKVGDCGIVKDTIAVLGFPDFFTPNGDGYHDTWLPIGYSPKIHINMKLRIYDRYGKLLHEIDLQGKNGWNGSYRGEIMPGTDYWYKATYQESFSGKQREFKGHFSLRR